ncbi:MAG: RodZ domain-containing protein [Syntrophobacteria bacterium]|nr:helix-turn-helix domain-containing protein [Deltaproteobacteria bacterium]
MKSLGEYLRAQRQARGIRLEQISADTRISMDMLRAIEHGNVEQLPAPIFIKGFLKAYAEKIGLDPEEVIVEYQNLIKEAGDHQERIVKFHQRLQPQSSNKKLLVLVIALTLLAGLVFFWYRPSSVRQQSKSSSRGEFVSPTAVDQRAVKSDPDSGINQAKSAQSSRRTQGELMTGSEPDNSKLGGQAAPAASTGAEVSKIGEGSGYTSGESLQEEGIFSPGQSPYLLKAEAAETTWIRISTDETGEHEYLLQPGEQLTWRASSSYKLLIGNAGGIQLYLNDEPLKQLGETGQVVYLKLPDPSLLLTPDIEQREPVNRP